MGAVGVVGKELRAAKRSLAAFRHEPILEALKASPDGIRTSKFSGVTHKGVHLAQPKQVAAAMEMCKAVVYHVPSGEYRLFSRAHRTALLEQWNPVKYARGAVICESPPLSS